MTRLGLAISWLAVGMILAAALPRAQSSAVALTFNSDIAPLVFKRCTPCHHDDGPAPFPLASYSDVRSRATQIVEVTGTRYMPPWLPEPGGPPFAHARRLTDGEIDRIARWVAQGAPEGEPAHRPTPPATTSGWQLGAPDLVVAMDEPYTVPAEGSDIYRNFVVPVVVEQRRFVRAVEFRPDNPRVIHHAVMAIDRTRSSRQRDRADAEPGYDGMYSAQAQSPEGHFVGWTPGKAPIAYDEDMAWRLDPGTDLVLQLHMTPAGKPEAVRMRIGLYFTSRPPERTPFMLRIGSKALDIPAGAAAYTATDRFVLPADVDLYGIYPHAHYLAQEVSGTATLQEGRTIPLIHIRKWDPGWQDEYRYAAPIVLPRGTTLSSRFTFDNSTANVRNPHAPPRRVAYGPLSTDEMGDLWLQVVPKTPDGLVALREAFVRRELLSDIEGYEATVRAHPDDPMALTRLGTFYFMAGRSRDAERCYRGALAIAPALSLAHYNLGLLFQTAGKTGPAIAQFREAAAADSQHPETHHLWGEALASQGRTAEAAEHYQEALRLWPEYADVLNSWGNLLVRAGYVEAGIERYRAALRIQPDHVAVLNNLGIALARTGRFDEAVATLRRAVASDPRDARSRINLEAALQTQRAAVRR